MSRWASGLVLAEIASVKWFTSSRKSNDDTTLINPVRL